MAENRDQKDSTAPEDAETVLLDEAARDRMQSVPTEAETVYARPDPIANPEYETDLPPTELLSEDEQAAADATTVLLDDAPVVEAGALDSDAAARGPQVIKDRFVLESRLGRGGMGHVYKALDLRKQEAQDDEPYVAIKFLSEEFSRHPKALISLQREAKKSQRLAHPNIVTVYDFDRDGDRVYMTMEYLEGEPLSGWGSIDFAPGKKPTVDRLIAEMAAGLGYAQRQGMVHSDFKPDNVFVTVDGRVKILDFGIARIADTELHRDTFDAGELGALTPKFASLEMLQGGDPHPADDVYALGLVAYQLYTGEHPYGGRTAKEACEAGAAVQPIRQIKRHQWRAIANALKLTRDQRTPTADAFLREFSGVRRRNRVLLGLVAVLALTSAYLAYEASRAEGPAVAFESLSPQVQQQFTDTLEMGRQHLAIGDWDGASRYFIDAYDLHPRNPDAEKGLEQVVQRILQLDAELGAARQRQALLASIRNYQDTKGVEYLSNHEQLTALRRKLERELEAP